LRVNHSKVAFSATTIFANEATGAGYSVIRMEYRQR